MVMNERNEEEVKINNEILDLRRLLFIFFRRWYFIVSFFIVFAVASSIYVNYFKEPIYQASTMLFVYRSTGASLPLSSELSIGAQLVNDVSSILKSRQVVQETIKRMDNPQGLTVELLSNNIKSSVVKDTRLLKIDITNKDPIQAAQIANIISNVIIEKFDVIMKTNLNNGEEFISIVENAIPNPIPINLNKGVTVIIASLLGLLFGFCVVILLEYFNNSVKSQDEAELYLGSTVIATIPKF